jgi:hypothetical protein
VPAWLASRMARLGRVIVEAVVLEYGRDELLRRLADPFWFQSFGAVMGMDWHSSGITTSVIGALKRGLAPVAGELGIHVCGGRGRHSRRTPDELTVLAERLGLDGSALVRASRLTAKVDSAAVQDGFALYLHGFIVADDGAWVVVQQGMNGARRQARRYHWIWDRARSFVDEPHAAIAGEPAGEIVNLTDRRAGSGRQVSLELARGGPTPIVTSLQELRSGPAPRSAAAGPRLRLPGHHDVRAEDIDLARLGRTLAAVADRGPLDFPELLLVPGVGARTLFAVALVAEVIHGAPSRFADPARFAFAHGGKDGHPFPVPLRVYDQTLRVLRQAVSRAKLGNDERLAALRRLDQQARALDHVGAGVATPSSEASASIPTAAHLARWVDAEWSARDSLGGRTVAAARPRSTDQAVTSEHTGEPRPTLEKRRRPAGARRREKGEGQLSLPFALR